MALLLMAFWLILNGRLDFDVIITGVIVSALIFAFACRFTKWSLRKELNVYILIPRGVMYFLTLLWEIACANFSVMKIVATGKTDPYLRTIKTGLKSKAARVVLANSITLTPGTVSVQLVNDRIIVHCLTKDMAEGLTGMRLERMLMKMEAKVYGKRV
ncbi:MAG: Na+/H+ antiporter subunit E [Clostridia bacterium]|nr:Na+/H+ antiporter subunit E [Clostridia bacterium]